MGFKDIEQIVYSYMDFAMALNTVAYLEIANSFMPFCYNLSSVFIYWSSFVITFRIAYWLERCIGVEEQLIRKLADSQHALGRSDTVLPCSELCMLGSFGRQNLLTELAKLFMPLMPLQHQCFLYPLHVKVETQLI